MEAVQTQHRFSPTPYPHVVVYSEKVKFVLVSCLLLTLEPSKVAVFSQHNSEQMSSEQAPSIALSVNSFVVCLYDDEK